MVVLCAASYVVLGHSSSPYHVSSDSLPMGVKRSNVAFLQREQDEGDESEEGGGDAGASRSEVDEAEQANDAEEEGNNDDVDETSSDDGSNFQTISNQEADEDDDQDEGARNQGDEVADVELDDAGSDTDGTADAEGLRNHQKNHCWVDDSDDYVDDGTVAGNARDRDSKVEREGTADAMLGFAQRLRDLAPAAPELRAAAAGWGWVVGFLGANMHYFKSYASEFSDLLAEMLHMPVDGSPDYAGLQEVNRDMLTWLLSEYVPSRLHEVIPPGEDDSQLTLSSMITVVRRMRLDDSAYLAYAKKIDRKGPWPVSRIKRHLRHVIETEDYSSMWELVALWADDGIPNQHEWFANPPPAGISDWFVRQIGDHWAKKGFTLPRGLDKEQLDFTMTHLPLMTRCYIGCSNKWSQYQAVYDAVDYIRDQAKPSATPKSWETDITGEFVQTLKLFGRPSEEWGSWQAALLQRQMPDGSWNLQPRASTDCYYILHTTYPVVMALMQPVLQKPPGYVPRPSLGKLP